MFNVEPYLPACIASLRAQHFKDLELIFVNDGSTDGSPKILEEAAARDERVIVVHQENRGPGPGGGRNGGLPYASGELIMFVDSDDVIAPHAIDEMASALAEPAVDMATITAARLIGNVTRPSSLHDVSHAGKDCITTLVRSPQLVFDSTPWNKLFRRTFFDRLVGSWAEGELYEDMFPMTRAHLGSTATAVLTRTGYLWRIRADGSSITQSVDDDTGDLAQLERIRAIDRMLVPVATAIRDQHTWKAYTHDLYWMLRKLHQRTPTSHQVVAKEIVATIDQLGTRLIELLSPDVRAIYEHVLANGSLLKSSVRTRLGQRDRRHLACAQSYQGAHSRAHAATSEPAGVRLHLNSATRSQIGAIQFQPTDGTQAQPAVPVPRKGSLLAGVEQFQNETPSEARRFVAWATDSTGLRRGLVSQTTVGRLVDRLRPRRHSGGPLIPYFHDNTLYVVDARQQSRVTAAAIDQRVLSLEIALSARCAQADNVRLSLSTHGGRPIPAETIRRNGDIALASFELRSFQLGRYERQDLYLAVEGSPGYPQPVFCDRTELLTGQRLIVTAGEGGQCRVVTGPGLAAGVLAVAQALRH